MIRILCRDALGQRGADLPPSCRTIVISRKSVNQENDGHEEEQIH